MVARQHNFHIIIITIILAFSLGLAYPCLAIGEYGADSSNVEKTESFFDTLKSKASQNRLTQELFEMLVNREGKRTVNIDEKSYDHLEKHNNKLIRKIEIIRLEVFGPEIYDTSKKASGVLEQTANNLHINTSRRIIKNHLILKPGHYFDHNQIADNERILRDLPSIHDARIFVSNVDSLNNTVDISVLVKDVWSTGFGIATNDFSYGEFELWDNNIFGTGHDFTNTLAWDNKKTNKFGYQANYKIRNMFGSFVNAEFNYISIFDHKEYNVKIERDFFTPKTKLAGGIEYRNARYDEQIKFENVPDTFRLDFEYTNVWMARAFPLNIGSFPDYRTNFVLTLAFFKYDFYKGPDVQPNLFYPYQSRAMLLGGIAMSGQTFYKTNLIYSFGRTEDIPVGLKAGLNIGYERNQFKDRLYTHLTINSAKHFPKTGYVFSSFDFSVFSDADGFMEQGAVSVRSNYFSNLYSFNRFRFRQFIKFQYVSGFGRYIDETVSLNTSNGIRNFRTDSIFAPKKMVFNLESVFFSPFYFYGFRFVFYGFFDVGYVAPSKKVLLSNKAYTGMGLGLRLRNDRLTFRTIQLQFGYYPSAPPDAVHLLLTGSGEPRFRPENFYVRQPEVFEFK
jgi:hypothetical protein